MQDWYPTAAADIVVIDVVVEDGAGNRATVETARKWQEQYGLSFDVVADTEGTWLERWGADRTVEWPCRLRAP